MSHLLTGTVLLTSTLSAFELPYMQHISMGTALFTQPALSVSELEKKTDGRKMKWLLISKWFINRRHLLHIRQEEMKAESHIPSDWLVMELELSQNQALLKVAFFPPGAIHPALHPSSASSKFLTLVLKGKGRRILDLEGETGNTPTVNSNRLKLSL